MAQGLVSMPQASCLQAEWASMVCTLNIRMYKTNYIPIYTWCMINNQLKLV